MLNPYAGVLTNNAIYASDTSLIDPFTGNTPVKSGVVNSIYIKAAEADLVVVEVVRGSVVVAADQALALRPINPLSRSALWPAPRSCSP